MRPLLVSFLVLLLSSVPILAEGQQPESEVACNEGVVAEPISLEYGDHTTNCAVDATTELDRFRFAASAGDVVRVVVDGLSNELDLRVEVRDAAGGLVATVSCDSPYYNSCSVIDDFEVAASGLYTIAIFDGGLDTTGAYQLQLERLDPIGARTLIPYGVAQSEVINPTTDVDFFAFPGAAGTTVRIGADGQSNDLDVSFELYAEDGTLVDSAVCSSPYYNSCSLLRDIPLQEDGTYLIVIRDSGADNTGNYALSLECLIGDCPSTTPGGGSCGDGHLDFGEECDDGNMSNGDCCSSTCDAQNAGSDGDGDGICDGADNCSEIYNPDQRNSDVNGVGDLCDLCPADNTNTCSDQRSTADTIGPDGGIVTNPDGTISVEIPPNVLNAPTSVSVTGPVIKSGWGLKLVADKTPLSFELEPSGQQFLSPVGVTFRWKDNNDDCWVDNPATPCASAQRPLGQPCPVDPVQCDLPVKEEDLQIFQDGKVFVPDSGNNPYGVGTTCGTDSQCNQKANQWTIYVSHFSEYVLGQASCSGVGNANLEVKNLVTDPGDEKVRFRGGFNIDVPIMPGLNPLANGFALFIETAGGVPVYSEQVEGGAYSAVTKTGWKKNPGRDTWIYKGKPPGIKTAKVSLLSAIDGRVKVNVTARALDLPALSVDDLPLKARISVDGRCGDATFPGPAPAPDCHFNGDQSAVICD